MSEFQPNTEYRQEKQIAKYISLGSAIAMLHGYTTLTVDNQNLIAQIELTGGLLACLASRLYTASPELYERRAVYDKIEQAENSLGLEPRTHAQKVIFISEYLKD